MPTNVSIQYRMCPCTARTVTFRDRNTKKPAVVFWCDPSEELAIPDGTVQLVAPNADLPRNPVIINLTTGERLASTKTVKNGQNRELPGIPISPDPLLIINQ